MKKVLLALAFALVFGTGESSCPDPCSIAPGSVPLKEKRCRAVLNSGDTDGVVVPTGPGTDGCVQSSTGGGGPTSPIACIGGRAAAPNEIEGCVCVGGQCTTGSIPAPDSAACTQAAIRGCAAAGAIVYEPNPGCGHCPGNDSPECQG